MKSCLVVLIVTLCLNAFVPVECASVLLDKLSISKRAIENEKEECISSTPCGWAIFDASKANKPITDFMQNTSCKCSSDKVCIRTNEDLSISSHVYRCKDKDQIKKA
ncbi:unnamed protein product [Diamesa hyperborea]